MYIFNPNSGISYQYNPKTGYFHYLLIPHKHDIRVANSVDSDQTAPWSSLICVYTVCWMEVLPENSCSLHGII